MNINIETSKWFEATYGSVIFPKTSFTEDTRGHLFCDAFGLCKPTGDHISRVCWVERGRFGYKRKITSPVEILKSINEGMKLFGYHNDVWIIPHLSQLKNGYRTYEKNKVKLSEYRFNFKNKSSVKSLMEKGQLFLENSKGDSILVLKGGKFPTMRSAPLNLNFLEID